MKLKLYIVYNLLLSSMLLPGNSPAASTIQFMAANFEANEADGQAQITVTCTPPPTGPIAVRLVRTGGTAEKGDFLDPRWWDDGLAIDHLWLGSEQTYVFVDMEFDSISEPDETVNFAITGITGDTVAGTVTNATLTIHNGGPRLQLGDIYDGMEGRSLLFHIVRRGDTNLTVSVDCTTTTNGTARPSIDFVPVTDRVQFDAGESGKLFTVPLLDDGRVEPAAVRTVEVLLSNPSNGATFDEFPRLGVIQDDETPATLDLDFAPEFGRWPYLMAVASQSDGRILIAGRELFMDGKQVSVLRLLSNGEIDKSFRTELSAPILQIVPTSDGKILVGGGTLGEPSWILARLLSNGDVDTSFLNTNSALSGHIIAQPDGKVVLWRNDGLQQLNADGSVNTVFAHNTTNLASICQVGMHVDGKLLVLLPGTNGLPSVLRRLNPDGATDSTFHEIAGGVEGFLVLSDGRLLLDGIHDGIGGDTSVRVLSLYDSDGSAQDSFRPQRSWFGFPVAEIAGYFYFLTKGYDSFERGVRLVRAKFEAQVQSYSVSVDPLFEIRFADRSKLDSYGFFTGLVPHQGSLLSWGPTHVNGTARPLARLRVQGEAGRAFEFMGDRRNTWGGPVVAANESDGTARIIVRRLGDVSEGGTVHFATLDGTARAGQSYEAIDTTLTFAPLEHEKTVVVPLIKDGVFRGIPHFFVVLSSPSTPAALDRPARVEILDQEFGLVGGRIISRMDGSTEFEYELTGREAGRNYFLEQSSYLKNWTLVPGEQLGGGCCGWFQLMATSPPFIRGDSSQKHGFFRMGRE